MENNAPKSWNEVQEMIDSFISTCPAAQFGPAHIALDDYNLGDGFIQDILRWIDALLTNDTSDLKEGELYVMGLWEDHGVGYLHKTKAFMLKLLEIPESVRDSVND